MAGQEKRTAQQIAAVQWEFHSTLDGTWTNDQIRTTATRKRNRQAKVDVEGRE